MTRFVWPMNGDRPLIDALVGLSDRETYSVANAGRSPPAPIATQLLLDTGAADTFLDATLVDQLGLTVLDWVPIVTGSTGACAQNFSQHEIALRFVEHGTGVFALYRPRVAVLNANLSGQGIGGLIGRDLMANFDVMISYRSNTLTLDV